MSYNSTVYREHGGDSLVVLASDGGAIKGQAAAGGAAAQAATTAQLTVSSGDATPDDTIADVSGATTATDGTTPGAASLKTDVDAALVAIDSNFADVGAKLNTIMTALKNAGLIAKT